MELKQTTTYTKRRIVQLSLFSTCFMSLVSYATAAFHDTASQIHSTVSAEQRLEPVDQEVSAVPEFQRQGIAFDLAQRASRIVTGRMGFSDRRGQNQIAVTFSGDGRTVIVDLGAAIEPIADDRAMDDLRQDIQLDFESRLKEFGSKYVVFRYGGKTFDDISPRVQRRDQSDIDATGPVVVNASHGLYRHHDHGWVFQREEHNGITEDLFTPAYAEELRNLISNRSKVPVATARPVREGGHSASGAPWNHMSAREHLADLYPSERSTIWEAAGNRQRRDIEYYDDIKSRPLFANHIGARANIHIHTNAHSDISSSGTRVVTYEGKDRDIPLGNNILCYMAEKIHAVAGYQDFSVSRSVQLGTHGENSFANAPSVIVETAFHTNPNDAEALKDPAFRTAAMKGVEKGYRLFAEGKPCQRFNLERIENKSLGTGETVTVEAEYKGFPDLPLKLEVKVLNCPTGWTCTGGTRVIRELGPSPLRFDMSCRAPESGSVDFETTLTDIDGVTSDRVQHYVNCSVPYNDRDPTVQGAIEMVPESDFSQPPASAIGT